MNVLEDVCIILHLKTEPSEKDTGKNQIDDGTSSARDGYTIHLQNPTTG